MRKFVLGVFFGLFFCGTGELEAAYSLVCGYCGKTYKKDKKRLIKHVCKKHREKSYYEEDYLDVIAEVKNDNEMWECLKCAKEFASEKEMVVHVERVHFHIGYKCCSCGKTYTQEHDFDQHLTERMCMSPMLLKPLVCMEQAGYDLEIAKMIQVKPVWLAQANLYGCTWPGCRAVSWEKQSMIKHMEGHIFHSYSLTEREKESLWGL